MMIPTYFLICLFAVLQFNSNIVLGQRTFTNPAVTDPAPCACNLQAYSCDPNCCCDPNCDDNDLSVSPVCQSTRTVSSYSSSQEENLQTWNCSNSTSDALYDYFPFVCVQMKLNEVIGEFYSTDNVTFVTSGDSVGDLPSIFTTEYPELFQSTTLSTPTVTNYFIGAPVQTSSGPLVLPGNLIGSICQVNANVRFGVNQDVACQSAINLCDTVISIPSVLQSASSSSSINISFYTQSYNPTSTTRNLTTEYYFQDNYILTINNITSTSGSIYDYCPYRHPLNRTQRYYSACNSSTPSASASCSGYQTWNGCALRNNFSYSAIPAYFFINESSSTDDSTNFADFNNAAPASLASVKASCLTNNIRRIFYLFNYSSTDNTISNVAAYLLTQTSTVSNPRITIEWNDIANNPTSNATIPSGYLSGEVLQFRRNTDISDVSVLVPTATGYCIDATRKTLRYKQSTSSQCFIQLAQSTIKSCHNLKLNMYLYLNIFYAPASVVLCYPNSNATQIPIRDTNQDSLDLDKIDETRPNNQLNTSYISLTQLYVNTSTIYDAVQNLPICFNVPSGIYIEFGFVRVSISPTVSFERIISVQYNYTYSNWQFDCTAASCTGTTQKYLVTFQSAFVDYTDTAFNLPTVTTADITSADNYIQHLLWLITPEYKGEPGYRNYTIAMILIFIAISAVVVHVLLFGIMCPF